MNKGVVFDGSSEWLLQDRSTKESYLANNMLSVCVNRVLRGGVNRTRPPFYGMKLISANGDESVLEDYATGNFQGAYAYQSISPATQDGLVVSIAGSIYFLAVNNNNIYVTKIATGNAANWMHTWFVQAEDWLYIQNGYQNPIAWNGDLTVPPIRLNPLAGQMPIGTIMEYAYGRVWVSTANNNVYASDIIYGAGFTTTSNTQNFTEQQYWAEGGSFTPPARFGNITGMKIMPSINVNDRGQGELVVMEEQGAFTLNGSIDRTLWQDNNIQKVSLSGRGNRSPWSTVGVNNEMFFRSDDGWSLYSNSQLDFNQRLSYRKLSREVNYWVDQDTKWLRQFASAMFFDNRLIATVSPFTVSTNEDRLVCGLHRPHRAMIVLDLDQEAPASPDSQISFRWNGLWEGPQPTQMLTAQINGTQRAFCFSFDQDNRNRLYELQLDGVDDTVDDKQVKIKSFFFTKRYDFAATQATNKFVRKDICAGDIWVSEMPESCKVSVSYRPDSYPCWNELLPQIEVGCDFCGDNKNCDLTASQPRQKRLKFPTPDREICQIGNDISVTEGAEFQLMVQLEGKCQVDRVRLGANLGTNEEAAIGDCNDDPPDCALPIDCCPQDTLGWYRIIS